jgi:hypothetical protein
MKRALIGTLVLILAAPGMGFAGKPDKDKKKDKKDKAQGTQVINGFNVDERGRVQVFFVETHGRGKCPPGLAKKNNGCLPPGQAKKLWAIGQPLAGTVVFYPLPGPLLMQLTPAPTGYQYVRVANDILLMAIGTRMIAAAIADLSAM